VDALVLYHFNALKETETDETVKVPSKLLQWEFLQREIAMRQGEREIVSERERETETERESERESERENKQVLSLPPLKELVYDTLSRLKLWKKRDRMKEREIDLSLSQFRLFLEGIGDTFAAYDGIDVSGEGERETEREKERGGEREGEREMDEEKVIAKANKVREERERRLRETMDGRRRVKGRESGELLPEYTGKGFGKREIAIAREIESMKLGGRERGRGREREGLMMGNIGEKLTNRQIRQLQQEREIRERERERSEKDGKIESHEEEETEEECLQRVFDMLRDKVS
jgi:hypothetical protein